MNAADLLAECKRRGVELRVLGDRLRYRAPVGALDDGLGDALRGRRREIIRALSAPEARPARDLDRPLSCAECGEHRPVMMRMEAPPQGEAWSLCSRCWRGRP